RFMSSFGLTSAFAVAVSLLVSFTLTPMLAARLIKRKDEGKQTAEPQVTGDGMLGEHQPAHASHHDSKDVGWFRHLDRIYTAMLRFSMAHR
ncbi:efflux RND transporter permease subunit, partial [Escherichia coli]|nr:efflux RND transporter permease subunit [Escherichia coli]